jgi:alkyl sulfatase BDS1-like metallo-beta-lactamase superfamily hydrolase
MSNWRARTTRSTSRQTEGGRREFARLSIEQQHPERFLEIPDAARERRLRDVLLRRGAVGLIAPNRVITQDFEEITLDGVKMVFQNTPDTEAPTEMNTYFPQCKASWAAENVTGTIHNIYTLRGAAVRNALNWSKHINVALWKFGQEAEVMFASHSWPRWGDERIQEVLRTQRDAYANLNNQALHYANQGVTINAIHNVYEVPKSLQQQWGRAATTVRRRKARGVTNRFLGHWDGNPATLIPLSPSDSAPLYVEILDKLVFAEPRNGMPTGTAPSTGSTDVIRSMPTGFWLDFLGISMDPKRSEGMELTINLVLPEIGKEYLVELRNATLTNIEGVQSPQPDLTLTLDRTDLNQVMLGIATFDSLAQEGKARFDGDRTAIYKLRDLMVTFTPDFEFIPGSAPDKRQVPPGRGRLTGIELGPRLCGQEA